MVAKSRKYNKGNYRRRYKTMKGGSSRLKSIRTAMSRVLSRSPNLKSFCDNALSVRTEQQKLMKQNSINKIAQYINKQKQSGKKVEQHIVDMFTISHFNCFYLSRVLPNYQTIYLLSDTDDFVELGANGAYSQNYPPEIVTPELQKLKELYDSFDREEQHKRKIKLVKNMELFSNLVGPENTKILMENKKVLSPERASGNIKKCQHHILGYPTHETKSLDKHFKKFKIKPQENISEKLKSHLDLMLQEKSIKLELNALPPVETLPPGFMSRLAALKNSTAGRKLNFNRDSRSKAKRRSKKKMMSRPY